jgi:hypothetical protein
MPIRSASRSSSRENFSITPCAAMFACAVLVRFGSTPSQADRPAPTSFAPTAAARLPLPACARGMLAQCEIHGP